MKNYENQTGKSKTGLVLYTEHPLFLVHKKIHL